MEHGRDYVGGVWDSGLYRVRRLAKAVARCRGIWQVRACRNVLSLLNPAMKKHYLRFVDGFWRILADGLTLIGCHRAGARLRRWNDAALAASRRRYHPIELPTHLKEALRDTRMGKEHDHL
jgi:hypothetical protein